MASHIEPEGAAQNVKKKIELCIAVSMLRTHKQEHLSIIFINCKKYD